ncbi:hypothetical protein [Achromobacter xylosoxidans]|uniref:hypothetical protein n=1 Tax=Alcaligenes xylosoxydans xylosoxydans TaxID=85698 RepID=UPI000B00541C|nr:hypothetical protein [Achromobacter xylosoxidans]
MNSDSRIVRFVKSFVQWSLPAKLLVTAIVGLLGGGFLGYNAEYATYNYAIQYGFRTPIEGIPYLRAAVTFGSFFLLLSGVAVFVTVWLVLHSIFTPRLIVRTFISKESRQRIIESPKIWNWVRKEVASVDQPSWAERVAGKTWLRTLIVATIISTTISYSIYLARSSFEDHPPQAEVLALFLAVSVPYVFALTVALLRPKAIVRVASVATVAYFVGALIFLWIPSSHAKLLRHLGYGGGLPVKIELADDHTTIPTNNREWFYLMSRTTDAYILFDRESRIFVELPRSSTRRLYTKSDRGWWEYELPSDR